MMTLSIRVRIEDPKLVRTHWEIGKSGLKPQGSASSFEPHTFEGRYGLEFQPCFVSPGSWGALLTLSVR